MVYLADIMKKSNDNPDIIFDELYDKYCRIAVEVAYSVLRDSELARDACQSAFSYLARNLDKVGKNEEKTRHYVLKVVRHFTIDAYRKNRQIKSHEIPLDEIEENDDGFSVESFENTVLKKYEVRDQLEALDRLSEKHRKYIKEYFYEELTMKQIAEKHGISEDAAKKRVYRSIAVLRKVFLRKGWQTNV